MHWRGSQAGWHVHSDSTLQGPNPPLLLCFYGGRREVAMRKQADHNWANGEKFNLMQAFQRQVGVSPPPRRVPLHATCLHLAAGLP